MLKWVKNRSFLNTIGHSDLHWHAASQHFLEPLFPTLATERKQKNRRESEKASPFYLTKKIIIYGLAYLGLDTEKLMLQPGENTSLLAEVIS